MLYGETMPETRKWNAVGVYREECRVSRWTAVTTEKLRRIMEEQPYLFLDEIREVLGLQTGQWWSGSWIWEKIRVDLDLTLQVVSVVAEERDEEARQRYRQSLIDFVHHPSQVVFLDETHKGRNAARRRRHWSRRGITPILSERFNGISHGKLYSMIAASDWNGFIIETCECVSREKDASGRAKTVDSEVFLEWVEDRLLPVLGQYDLMEARSVVILDNASIHHSEDTIALIESTGARVIFTAPYSPDLNPIEYMFGQYKKGLQRNAGRNWMEAHTYALFSVTPQHGHNYFRRCGIPGCENAGMSDPDESSKSILKVVALWWAEEEVALARILTIKCRQNVAVPSRSEE